MKEMIYMKTDVFTSIVRQEAIARQETNNYIMDLQECLQYTVDTLKDVLANKSVRNCDEVIAWAESLLKGDVEE
jgi:hypothetical protein